MIHLHKLDVCVCVQDSLRKSVCHEKRNQESPDSGVCENTHTTILPKLVSLVSTILVLVWYHKCKQTYSCGTRSSTTDGVVR